MKILPLPGDALIELFPHDDKSDGGIVIPDNAKDKNSKDGPAPADKGVVREIGKWPTTESGLAIIPHFKKGDTVLLSHYDGKKMHRDALHRFRIIKQQDVLAVLS